MLKEYEKKRDFKKTTEPKSEKSRKKKADETGHLFVIQDHHASHHHYDLRLEHRGVLKSWALPKGMPKARAQKHLAVETEDHPLSYANFEGVIPEGQYGAGTVKIHDRGTFENLTHDKTYKPVPMTRSLKNGHVLFRLHGNRYKKKVYALHRFRQEKKDLWLLIALPN